MPTIKLSSQRHPIGGDLQLGQEVTLLVKAQIYEVRQIVGDHNDIETRFGATLIAVCVPDDSFATEVAHHFHAANGDIELPLAPEPEPEPEPEPDPLDLLRTEVGSILQTSGRSWPLDALVAVSEGSRDDVLEVVTNWINIEMVQPVLVDNISVEYLWIGPEVPQEAQEPRVAPVPPPSPTESDSAPQEAIQDGTMSKSQELEYVIEMIDKGWEGTIPDLAKQTNLTEIRARNILNALFKNDAIGRYKRGRNFVYCELATNEIVTPEIVAPPVPETVTPPVPEVVTKALADAQKGVPTLIENALLAGQRTLADICEYTTLTPLEVAKILARLEITGEILCDADERYTLVRTAKPTSFEDLG